MMMATKIKEKPINKRKLSCSPYSSTLNSTPNTDSRLRNNDACAGGICANATFWMPNATMEAKMARNSSWPMMSGVNTANPGNV